MACCVCGPLFLSISGSQHVKVAGAIRGPSISELQKLQLEQLEEQRKTCRGQGIASSEAEKMGWLTKAPQDT